MIDEDYETELSGNESSEGEVGNDAEEVTTEDDK